MVNNVSVVLVSLFAPAPAAAGAVIGVLDLGIIQDDRLQPQPRASGYWVYRPEPDSGSARARLGSDITHTFSHVHDHVMTMSFRAAKPRQAQVKLGQFHEVFFRRFSEEKSEDMHYQSQITSVCN